MDWKNTTIPFDPLTAIACIVVDDVIKDAVEVVTEERLKEAVKNIKWMMCKDFTTARGLLKIEEYMKTWELHKSWLHYTNYTEDEELQYSTRYHYRVRWSIPTCRKPIPRATANVYFVIEISKIKPNTLPVEVFFVIETNRFIHRPGECRFKEKWLKDIIESKVTLMEVVNF
uniref:A-kinase anchor protein 14 n=1 Tax=Euleptes europaea TaxID=460621 RepID=UPI002540C9C1|nr:A-kinase anchor protein 14 [Euleptes europaea]